MASDSIFREGGGGYEGADTGRVEPFEFELLRAHGAKSMNSTIPDISLQLIEILRAFGAVKKWRGGAEHL